MKLSDCPMPQVVTVNHEPTGGGSDSGKKFVDIQCTWQFNQGGCQDEHGEGGLINPSHAGRYGSARAGITSPVYPALGLATIAARAEARGHLASIIELSYRPHDPVDLRRQILDLYPHESR